MLAQVVQPPTRPWRLHQASVKRPSPGELPGQLRHLQPATEPWAWYTLVISGSSTNKWWLPGEYTMNTSPKCMYKSAGLPACLIGRCCSCFCSWFVLVSVLGLYLFLCSLAARFCFVWIKVAPLLQKQVLQVVVVVVVVVVVAAAVAAAAAAVAVAVAVGVGVGVVLLLLPQVLHW